MAFAFTRLVIQLLLWAVDSQAGTLTSVLVEFLIAWAGRRVIGAVTLARRLVQRLECCAVWVSWALAQARLIVEHLTAWTMWRLLAAALAERIAVNLSGRTPQRDVGAETLASHGVDRLFQSAAIVLWASALARCAIKLLLEGTLWLGFITLADAVFLGERLSWWAGNG